MLKPGQISKDYCGEDGHQLSFVPSCGRTEKMILIDRKEEQTTYLVNPSKYKDG